jgi:hypothetical protein
MAIKSSELLGLNAKSHLSLYIFLGTSELDYMNSLTASPRTFDRIRHYANISSASLDNTAFNNNLTLSSLASSNNLLARSYEGAIKENLSVANQTR